MHKKGVLDSCPAFSLVEVLVVLAIFGVVVMLTLPAFMNNWKNRWKTPNDALRSRLVSAVGQMNIQGRLSGRGTTLAFVQELQNYIDITKICDGSAIALNECFVQEGIAEFSVDGEYAEVVSFSVANGSNVLVAYRPVCMPDFGEIGIDVLKCSVLVLHDVNGFAKPNVVGEDILYLMPD